MESMKTIGIIGAGQMGSGIASVCLAAGLTVILNDRSVEIATLGIERISADLARMRSKGQLNANVAVEALKRVKPSGRLEDVSVCGLVIEAATEDFSIKTNILKELDTIIQPSTLIASNTSSVSITKLAAVLCNPTKFIGLHFFNPAPVMTLVEIIRGLRTNDESYEKIYNFVQQIGKTAISVKDSPGFAVNRILLTMINESIFALQEGIASAKEIDDSMRLGANHPIGPLALADLIGLDTVLNIMNVLTHDFNDPKYRPPLLLKHMVEAGFLGKKTGKGFHNYVKPPSIDSQ